MDIPSEAANNGQLGLGVMGALRKARARRPLCAIIENNKCAAGADNNNKGNNTMNYKDIIGRLMMLASRMEAEGKDLDRQACAEAAGVLMSLNEVRVLPHSSLMQHPSLQKRDN
jgi:hypothetical protein